MQNVRVATLIMLIASSAGTVPATAPSTTHPSIRAWFDQLADADPDVRDQARVNLMGLDRAELPELQRIVKEARPLRPNQISELHDIVTQVYLSGEPYDPDKSGAGFLGVSWPPGGANVWDDPPGIVIESRIKGFAAYRYLRDGDVIVGIAEAPGVPMLSSDQLSIVIQACGGGKQVTLRVLRGGRITPVKLMLSSRPNWRGNVVQVQAERETKAEGYWNDTFGKLMSESVSSAGS